VVEFAARRKQVILVSVVDPIMGENRRMFSAAGDALGCYRGSD